MEKGTFDYNDLKTTNVIAWLIAIIIVPVCVGLYSVYAKKFTGDISSLAWFGVAYLFFAFFIVILLCIAYNIGSIKKRYYMANFYSIMFWLAILKGLSTFFTLYLGEERIPGIYFIGTTIGNVIIIVSLHYISVKDVNVYSSIIKFKKVYFDRTDELKEYINLKEENKRK
jgi:hypothetical protein